jgi:CRISPR-associated endonuclease/helicase Cas3
MTYIAHTREDGTEQSIINHLHGTAELAAHFAEVFGGGGLARVCGLAHDVGKFSERFQARIRGSSVRVDHSTAGGQLLQRSGSAKILGLLAAYCVLGHHGGLPDGGSTTNTSDDPTLHGRLKRKIEDYSAYNAELTLPDLTLPDFQIPGGFEAAFFIRMLFSALVDADYLDTERFMSGVTPRGGQATIPELKECLFEQISDKLNPPDNISELNSRRTALLENCVTAAERAPGLFTLTAPTGSGKTIASLAFALTHAVKHGKRRVIFVVPYNTIIEQNAKVFEDLLGVENVLQHHSNVRYDDTNDEENRKRHSTENWDFPVIVTSSVRFFESLFSNRPSDCRKLHNIADSVIIFDEAQMLPQSHLIPCVRAIGELVRGYGCTAVLATATQSALEGFFKNIAPLEISANPRELYEFLRRSEIRQIPEPLTDDELAFRLRDNSQVLCIVNTRKQVQSLFQKLDIDKSGNTFHLSTTMYPAHRSRVLSEIRSRLANQLPCRVVSTSLVEAGVDLDFPAVYRAEAGLDSIIQAAGRCNREGKRSANSAVVYVFRSAEHKPPRSIAPNIAAAAQVIRNFSDIASLEAIRGYFEQLYYNNGNDALDKKQIVPAFDSELKSFSFPFKTVSDEFRIIDEDTQTIYVLHEAPKLEERLRSGERNRKLFRELGQYSISLYRQNVRALLELGAVERLDQEILLLTEKYYDSNCGVTLSPEGGYELFA